MDSPQILWIPITVIERPVWLLNDDQRKTVGVTVEQREMCGSVYDLYYMDGERIDPNITLLVPVQDGDL